MNDSKRSFARVPAGRNKNGRRLHDIILFFFVSIIFEIKSLLLKTLYL